jgi:abscisic-aldehyde oxidase
VLNDGSIVVEVGGIEIGQGLWTKVQQMTAFALGKLWPDGGESLLERVRVLRTGGHLELNTRWTYCWQHFF